MSKGWWYSIPKDVLRFILFDKGKEIRIRCSGCATCLDPESCVLGLPSPWPAHQNKRFSARLHIKTKRQSTSYCPSPPVSRACRRSDDMRYPWTFFYSLYMINEMKRKNQNQVFRLRQMPGPWKMFSFLTFPWTSSSIKTTVCYYMMR